uniref:Uncharacterized protein n=1 Tax=Romanomermis culicivorax TaxID=13658 RepID=A0A915J022_ROMCU
MDVVFSDVKGMKEEQEQQISLVAERNNVSKENKFHKDEQRKERMLELFLRTKESILEGWRQW